MKVFDDCGAINYTKNIGPFSTNTDLGNINVSISNCYPTVVVADFTYTAPGNIVPVPVTFSNTSRNATNYVWDFGDSSTSTEMDPRHFYTTAGDYTVTLIATANGISDTTFKILHLSASDAYINLTLNGVDYSWTPSNYVLSGKRSYDTGSNSYTLISTDTLPIIFPSFSFALTIHHDNASPGNIPAGNYPFSLYTVINGEAYNTYLISSNPETNVTQYESAGGYITGSATGWIKKFPIATTDSFPFTCTYRVVRIQ